MMEIRAAAPPPTPLKMATSWGIAVIFTKRATGTAMAAPSAMAMMASTRFVPEWPQRRQGEGHADGEGSRRRTDAGCPAGRGCGELRPFRATMKPTMATR